MGWEWLLLIIFGVLVVLMASGMPIAFSFMIINVVGVYVFFGGTMGLEQMILSLSTSLTTFVLLPVALFILMGELLVHSNIAVDVMDALDKLMGRLPGRLSLLAVATGTVIAALTGSSMSSTAMLGQILVPEMEHRGYKKAMTVGPIMASGGLAIMIPPSSLAILLCVIGEISIGKVLVVIPFAGLYLAALLAAYIIIRCKLQPDLAPTFEVEKLRFMKRISGTVKFVLPVGFIIFLVVGLIFVGVADPSESAAMGTIGMVIVILCYRRLTWKVVKKSIHGTIMITGMVFLIIAGATTFGQILAFSGATAGLSEFAVNLPLPPVLIMVAMQVIILIMGCFMEVVSIMMITLPIFVPVINKLGFDPVWFGAIALLNIECAFITPPFGMNLFVMKGVAKNTTMEDIYFAAAPMVAINCLMMALMIAFPSIVLWPVKLMG
ncbi:MAG TPA: TRAP transporter large permease subunit [Thermodesulfobacteriota bacterium]|nr:TRAP transporter large permease subunit [Thermodesulfobacteriota bacterium]